MTIGLSLGEILGDLLSETNMTQKQLAEALSIHTSTLSSYIQGAREPNFATLKRLADYFGVTTDYLLDHRTNPAVSRSEDELLRVFRALTDEGQELYIELGKVLISQNKRRETRNSL